MWNLELGKFGEIELSRPGLVTSFKKKTREYTVTFTSILTVRFITGEYTISGCTLAISKMVSRQDRTSFCCSKRRWARVRVEDMV
jgi:hypothetical protein